MDKEQKCGIQIVVNLMLEKYMLVLFLRVKEMELGFVHISMVDNMKEVGKIMFATVRGPLNTLMERSRRGFLKMVRSNRGLDLYFLF
jgi:hypothetical protein